MPRIIERTVYAFAELSDTAKEAARESWRLQNRDDEWWGGVFDNVVECAKCLGIEIDTHTVKLHGGKTGHMPSIYFHGFWSQGDGASFCGRYNLKPDAVEAITAHAPKDEELRAIAKELTKLQITARLKVSGTLKCRITTNNSNYCHSNTMNFETVYVDTEDEAPNPSDQEDKSMAALLRRFADWIYARLEAEDEYLNSDECIDEQLTSNEYVFDEDGAMI